MDAFGGLGGVHFASITVNSPALRWEHKRTRTRNSLGGLRDVVGPVKILGVGHGYSFKLALLPHVPREWIVRVVDEPKIFLKVWLRLPNAPTGQVPGPK